jgi:hypothetical protein
MGNLAAYQVLNRLVRDFQKIMKQWELLSPFRLYLSNQSGNDAIAPERALLRAFIAPFRIPLNVPCTAPYYAPYRKIGQDYQ